MICNDYVFQSACSIFPNIFARCPSKPQKANKNKPNLRAWERHDTPDNYLDICNYHGCMGLQDSMLERCKIGRVHGNIKLPHKVSQKHHDFF